MWKTGTTATMLTTKNGTFIIGYVWSWMFVKFVNIIERENVHLFSYEQRRTHTYIFWVTNQFFASTSLLNVPKIEHSSDNPIYDNYNESDNRNCNFHDILDLFQDNFPL